MNTEDDTTEFMRKLQIRASQDLSMDSDSPKAQFADLPTEVIEVIVDHVDKCYPLLLLCKQTLIPAGEKLYSKGPAITTEFPSRMRPMGFKPLDPFLSTQATLPQLLCGMDIKEPSPLSPFRRDLKIRFMRRLPGIHHHLLSEKEYDHLSGYVGIQRRISWNAKCAADLLKSLLDEGLRPFPALLDLRLVFHPKRMGGLHPYNCASTNPFMIRRQQVVENLAALCKPERFEWCLFALSNRWSSPLDYPPDTRLKFADGHAPHEVHHRVSDSVHDEGLEWIDRERPLPTIIHGANNVVHVKVPAKDTKSERNLSGACSYYVSRVLEVVEKADWLAEHESKSMTLEEQELRAKTRWCFQWSFEMVGTKADADARVGKVKAWLESRIGHTKVKKSSKEKISVECVYTLRS